MNARGRMEKKTSDECNLLNKNSSLLFNEFNLDFIISMMHFYT